MKNRKATHTVSHTHSTKSPMYSAANIQSWALEVDRETLFLCLKGRLIERWPGVSRTVLPQFVSVIVEEGGRSFRHSHSRT